MKDIGQPPTNLQALGRRLQVLAGPHHILIFHLLMEGVQCNCELGEALGLPPNLVSHYLRALRNAGLVDADRDPIDARWVHYSINREALEELVRAFDVFFDPARIKPGRSTARSRAAAEPGRELMLSDQSDAVRTFSQN